MRKIIPLLVLAWTGGANAAPCDTILQPVLVKAFPTATFEGDKPTQFALPGKDVIHGKVLECRGWPGNADLTLIAVGLDADDESIETPAAGTEIMVVDSSSGAVRARRHEPELFSSKRDPSSLSFNDFDGARYTLAPDRLTFGIRLGRGSRRFGEGLHRLYLLNGDKLDPIAEWVSSEAHNFKGFDTSDKAQCRDGMDELLDSPDIKRTAAIGRTRSHGLADLLVSETRTPHGYALECGAKVRPARTRYTLKFDGKEYKRPD